MNKLNPFSFATAIGLTAMLFNAACALAVWLAPDGTLAFANAWMHGIDLTVLQPPGGRPWSTASFFYGLIGIGAAGFAAGFVAAAIYNRLQHDSNRERWAESWPVLLLAAVPLLRLLVENRRPRKTAPQDTHKAAHAPRH